MDLYLRVPDLRYHDIRNYSLSRIKEMRSYNDFSPFYEKNRSKPNLPTSSEIILCLLVTYVLEHHPSLNVFEDYKDIMDAYLPPRSGKHI